MSRMIAWFTLLISLLCSMTCLALPFSTTYVSGASDSSSNPILFNMVPNSTQQLKFNITSTTGSVVIIKCSMTSSSLDSFGSLGGCANVNGAGAGTGTSSSPAYPLVITITSGSTPGTVSHTLTIQDFSGRNVVNIPIQYTIASSSARTITFQNYCPFNVWFGIATGTLPPTSGSTCTTALGN